MSSYRLNNGRGARRLWAATLVLALVLALDLLSGGALRSLARGAALPAWSAGSRIASAVSGSGFFSSRRALQEENDALKRELALLRVRAAEARVLRDEAEKLRALSGLAALTPGVAAPVVSSASGSPYGTFLIGAGTENGVANGDLVLAGNGAGGIVIGRVSEPGARRSLVTELFAPGARLEATIAGAPLEAEGRGEGNARAEAPSTLPVAAGDVVFSSHAGGRAVGLVGAIREEPGSAYKTVFIRTPPVSELGFVYVIPRE